MVDSRQGRFRLWPWRHQPTTVRVAAAPPTPEGVAEKLAELVQFERGVAALYYYLPDASLATLAQDLCQSHQVANKLELGVDRDIRSKTATPDIWRAVSVIWHSDVWQPGEILATFGFRLIEILRGEPELWGVVVDPRAQFFGLAATADQAHRYWLALAIGQKGEEMAGDVPTAAR
jgi:hypothetical protein